MGVATGAADERQYLAPSGGAGTQPVGEPID